MLVKGAIRSSVGMGISMMVIVALTLVGCGGGGSGSSTPAASTLSSYVSEGGLTWMPVSSTQYTYAQASALCAGTINGLTGWRLPLEAELSALYTSGAMNGQGWMLLGGTWSSTPNLTGTHNSVNLTSGTVNLYYDTNSIYVTCVR